MFPETSRHQGMTTKLTVMFALLLAACGAKTSAPPVPQTPVSAPIAEASCDEPLPAPAPTKPSFEDLGEGSCSK